MTETYFSGKTIVITGASSGIGRELALQIASPKVRLILAARRINELASVEKLCIEKGATCFCFYLDVSDSTNIENFCTRLKNDFDKIDVLINNAGISQRSLAAETQPEVDRMIMEVNFFGAVHLTKLLFPLLIRSVKAQVVVMSSLSGTFGYPLRSAYAASKHAVEGFFESWSLENQNQNIFFTIVAPGRIKTDISFSALKQDGTAHGVADEEQLNGIPVEVCAAKIIRAIKKQKRKIYIVQNEWVLIILHKYCYWLFAFLIKKLKLK